MLSEQTAAAPPPAMPQLRRRSACLCRAALILAQLSKEVAGEILAQLRPREVEQVTAELVRLRLVDSKPA